MTQKYECDRCGNIMDSPTGSIETTLIRGEVNLCRNCVFLFKRFIKYNEDLENHG